MRNKQVAVHGWVEQTGLDVFDFIRRVNALGVTQFSVTDIERDGALTGPAVELYREIRAVFPEIELTASGGISNVADFETLRDVGCSAVIIGKAFFEGLVPMKYFSVYTKA